MNKTLEILFNKFAEKQEPDEICEYFITLYDKVTAGKGSKEEDEILELFVEYQLAIEKESFTAGFYSAVQLFTREN